MKLIILTIVLKIQSFLCAELQSSENNDKWQDINNQYVAEWQWESWPVKQDSTEKNAKWPGPRVNIALWKDSSGPNWYLFGGQSLNPDLKKVYSDVWKYSVESRLWERFFPSSSEVKGTNFAKIGGLMTLRANLFDEGYKSKTESQNYNVILCGGVSKSNSTKIKKQSVWNNFTRRKKEPETEKKELRSLVVYAPKTFTSNTVWQIDLKDKLWTAYVCCCDSSTSNENLSVVTSTEKITDDIIKKTTEAIVKYKRSNEHPKKNILQPVPVKLKTKEKEQNRSENEETKSNIDNNIDKIKKLNEHDLKKFVNVEKKDFYQSKDTNKSNDSSQNNDKFFNESKKAASKLKTRPTKTKNENHHLKVKNNENKPIKGQIIENVTKINANITTEKSRKITEPKIASKYCPEFTEGIEPVTWCDGNNEMLITADITSPQITLWMFNLKTSHWSQKEVKISNGTEWPGCSPLDFIRYAGNEEVIYIICSPVTEKENPTKFTKTPMNESSKSPFDPSSNNFYLNKIVFQINYKTQLLQSLGQIQLSSYFKSDEGKTVWQNETKSHWQVIRMNQNEIFFIFAYLDAVDLWILIKDPIKNRYRFETIEKIWRGSALKWFNKYNGPLYNFQLITESGMAETVLLPNPRIVGVNEYWPRDRGRFIIRLFKNDNLKNQSLENRTREHNLTYQLLQSDYKSSGSESQFNHNYSIKVLVFFGISLAMFTVFGFVMFLKRCVNCPPRIRTRNEHQKSPLVIHYSVIPEDLFYPVA